MLLQRGRRTLAVTIASEHGGILARDRKWSGLAPRQSTSCGRLLPGRTRESLETEERSQKSGHAVAWQQWRRSALARVLRVERHGEANRL